MSESNDESRPDQVPEISSLPTPEPLVAAEPPPPRGNSALTGEQSSWRNLGGARQESAVPPISEADAHATRGVDDSGDDTTVGTLGEEPMGGAPREQPAVGPAAPAIDAAIRRPQPGPMSRVGEELFAWLKTLASAAVYATLIVTFGFQVARVEGQSMAPTLADQDRLIVNKLAYRLGPPQVGDIVMLYYPLNPEKSFVKRVIAEEGDQIRIVDGRVYRNDVPINDDYVPPEFRSHDDYGPEVVPQGYYFVMGDNRSNSSDSRHWKFVPKKYIIGKVQLRWWPLPNGRIF
jgi:signal peptidase I